MRPSRLSGAVAAVMLAALAAGCSSQHAGRFASFNAAVPSNATIAFESIDGPPPEVFRKLVTALNDEAGTRRVAVVSRSDPATYRVRGYVSALVDRDRTTFAWVWDVYDSDKRRALRITGEEPAHAKLRRRDARTDAWTAADDEVLRRMSRTGMERIAAFLNAPGQPPAAEPEPAPPILVARRDDSPEAAGIFRIFGGSAPQTEPTQNPGQNPVQAPEAEAPKPAPRPAPPRRRSAAAQPAAQSAALDP
jgi:hypothetical protein